MANPGMQNYYGVRGQPIPFECTDGFWKSVDDYCQPNMRHLLVKAIAKKVYGILGCVDISPQPDESGSEMKKAQISGVQLLKPGEYPPVMLYFVDEAFDQVTLPV